MQVSEPGFLPAPANRTLCCRPWRLGTFLTSCHPFQHMPEGSGERKEGPDPPAGGPRPASGVSTTPPATHPALGPSAARQRLFRLAAYRSPRATGSSGCPTAGCLCPSVIRAEQYGGRQDA